MQNCLCKTYASYHHVIQAQIYTAAVLKVNKNPSVICADRCFSVVYLGTTLLTYAVNVIRVLTKFMPIFSLQDRKARSNGSWSTNGAET